MLPWPATAMPLNRWFWAGNDPLRAGKREVSFSVSGLVLNYENRMMFFTKNERGRGGPEREWYSAWQILNGAKGRVVFDFYETVKWTTS
ncbi:MAG: hypothetical protein HW374_1367 [Bacteroidetes bacterium]|nr:hypothetical protein [Bacteroidota bacterium]